MKKVKKVQEKQRLIKFKHEPHEFLPVIINAKNNFLYEDSELPTVKELTQNGEYEFLSFDLDEYGEFDLTAVESVETVYDKNFPEFRCVIAVSKGKMIMMYNNGSMQVAIKK